MKIQVVMNDNGRKGGCEKKKKSSNLIGCYNSFGEHE